MAIEDEVSEGSSSFILKSHESDEKSEVLSPEDIAWVDSCLIKESETFDGDWNSMTDALLKILSCQTTGVHNYSATDGSLQEKDVEMLTSTESAEADGFLEIKTETEEFPRSPNDRLSINNEAESSSDGSQNRDVNDLHSLAFVGNPFLPSYVEGLSETQAIELKTESSSSVDDIKPVTDDIFRVWDLNIPAEENELDKQLNKVLEESDPQLRQLAFDDSGPRKDLKEESLDDVIAAIANISLD